MQLVCARVMGSYWKNRHMTWAPDQPCLGRRKGRLLCGAKTRAGGCCQVSAEPGQARCRFYGVKSAGPKTQAGARASPRRGACGGVAIERGFGRSQVMTKPDPKAKYLLAATYLVTL